jgi:hypothetical protein
MPADIARRHCETQDHGLAGALDHQLIAAAAPAIEKKAPVQLAHKIRNANHGGAMPSGAVARKYGHAGLAEDTIHVAFEGWPGRASGFPRGITFELQGATNDYVGGVPATHRRLPGPAPGDPQPTSHRQHGDVWGDRGEAFRGVAASFCVRNSGVGRRRRHRRSGAFADRHGRRAGRNRTQFRAGMSGGWYV